MDEQEGHTVQLDVPITWRAGKPIAVSELLRRLQVLFHELKNLEQQEANTPSLLLKAQELANAMLLNHKDKGVRAWALMCIVEMFRITVPVAPYKSGQLRSIFELFISTVIPALASPSDPYSQQYLAILTSLTTIKSILLLTEIPGSDLLIQTLFQNCFDVISGNVQGAHGEHLPKNVEYHMTNMLATLVEECQTLPTGVDDCILAQFLRADPNMVRGDDQPSAVLKDTSPAYNMARNICNQAGEKMTRAIGQYFSSVLIDASESMSNTRRVKGRGKKRTHDESEDDSDDGLLTPPAEEDLSQVEAAHRLLRELWRSSPDVIQNVIPQIEAEMVGENLDLRTMAVQAIGDMIAGIGAAGPPPSPSMDPAAHPSQSLSSDVSARSDNVTLQPRAPRAFSSVHPVAYQAFLDRHRDKSAQVRTAWVTAAGRVLSTSAGGKGLDTDQEDELLRLLSNAMLDGDEKVRLAAVLAVACFDYSGVIEKLCKTGGVNIPDSILSRLADRIKDTKRSVRTAAIDVISRIWGVAAGAIVEGRGRARELLGAIPNKVFEAHFVNNPEINASIYRVMFDSLLPFGYPPVKPKIAQLSQLVADSQGAKEREETDPDAIRTDRILALVRDLDEKGQRVFYSLQAQQPTMAKYMDRYLTACEDLKNSEAQTDAKKNLSKYIPFLVKPLADREVAVEHMKKFADHYDRRNYHLIRLCISPDSDYRKITKALRELTKRLGEGPSNIAAILGTLIPVVKMVAVLVYNRSHMPTIMKTARDDVNGLGSAAHDLLNQISANAPSVFKAYVHELCDELKAQEPTVGSSQNHGTVHTLKACAGFAKRAPNEMPKDREFFKALVSFAKYGSPPEAAKHAVTVLVASADRKEMYIKDLLKHCLTAFDINGEGSLAKLATLSQLKLVAHPEVEEHSDAITDIAASVLGGIIVTDDRTEYTDAGVDDELSSKLWALKLLVNDVRGQITTGDPHEALERIGAAAERVYKLLNTLVAQEGELSQSGEAKTPESHKVALRLAAGVQILKLSCSRVTDQILGPRDFNKLAQLTQDPKESVRTGFGNALKKYLGQGKLTTRFYAFVFLYAFEPAKQFKRATETWIKSRAARSAVIHDTLPESTFPRLLSLLAHHQDFDVADVDDDFVEYIVFFLRNVASEANLPILYNIAERLKTVQDAIEPDESERLYIISDLAQATIRAFQDQRSWSLQLSSKRARLPGIIFVALPDHDTAQTISETRFAPDELMERIDELVKSSLSTRKKSKPQSKKRKSDGISTPVAKRVRREPKQSSKTSRSKATKIPRRKTSDTDAMPSAERRKSSRTSISKNYAESDSEDVEEEVRNPRTEPDEGNASGDEEDVGSTPPTSDPTPDPVPDGASTATIGPQASTKNAMKLTTRVSTRRQATR